MKTHILKISIAAFTLLLFVFSSCKKDGDLKSAKDYLTAGNWKIVAATVNPGIELNGNILTDLFSMILTCDEDNLLKFNPDGTLTWDEGATKCDPNDPQTSTEGNWTLSENGNTLTIQYPEEEPVVNTIETLNGSTFTFSYSSMGPNPSGDGNKTYIYTMTMELQ